METEDLLCWSEGIAEGDKSILYITSLFVCMYLSNILNSTAKMYTFCYI